MKNKRWLSLTMAAVMVCSCAMGGTELTVLAADNTPPDKPENLKTEMLSEAYGINTKNPSFSWEVQDEDKNEVQTAYRILVSGTSELKGEVLDTGWVESDESSFVRESRLESLLQNNELYYWQVQTKDKDGDQSPLSDPAPFMTDIADEWVSTNGIWATPDAAKEEENPDENLWTDYTVEQTMSVKEGGGLAMLLRMGQSDRSGYMVQFRTNDNVIRFHKIDKGVVNSVSFAELNLESKGITLPKDETAFQVKLQAAGSQIRIGIRTGSGNDAGEYQDAGSVSIASAGNLLSGTIGYRTGRTEKGSIDNLTVTASDGSVLYHSDFSKGSSDFEGCTIQDGVLNVGYSAFGIYAGNLTRNLWTDYTIEETMSVTGGDALAMLLRTGQTDKTGYMVQFRTKDNVIRFHKIDNTVVNSTNFAELKLSDSKVVLPTDGSEFKVKIQVTGSQMTFLIDSNAGDGKEEYVSVGSVDIASQGNIRKGTIGFRTGRSESGTVDNLRVTSADQTVLYSSDFSVDDGFFSGCSVKNGKLNIGNSVFSVYGGSLTETNFNWYDYTVDQTICTTDNIYTLFRFAEGKESAYMYRINPAANEMEFLQRANSSSPPVLVQKLTLPESVTLTSGQPFRIRITTSGNTINTWIDPVSDKNDSEEDWILADENRDVSALNYGAGYIGYRTDTDAAAVISNITITSSYGNVAYQSSFTGEDAENPFSETTLENGCLVVPGNLRSCAIYRQSGNLKELSNFSFIRSPKLTVDKDKVDKAIVSVSSRGTAKDRGVIFDVFMNDNCLGAGSARELANVGKNSGNGGYTQVFYNSYDVTELLNSGTDNVISAVGNCRDTNRGILVQMTVFYKDGTKQILTNSGTEKSGWKTLDGTQAFGDEGIGIGTGFVTLLHENINAEKYPAGFTSVEFNDSKWASAKVISPVAENKSGTQGRVLTPFSSENSLRVETNEPAKRVYKNEQGNVVVDLGKEIIGGMKINLSSDASQKVTVHMGEEMNGDGTVKWKLTAVPAYEDIWTFKKGTNAFETVTMRNFRYVEFIGLDSVTADAMINNPDSVKGWAIQQEFDQEDSSFTAEGGSPEAVLLNRLYEFSKYTIQATNQDVFVDSQARERAPYEGDLLVNSNTSYAVSGNYSLARHSNEWLMDNPTWPNDYRLFSVEMAYWDYIYTGNTDSLEENYEALKQKLVLQIEFEDASTGLIRPKGGQAGNSSLIDWPTSERDGYQASYYDVVFNAEYVGIYQNMAVLCTALGRTEDAAYYTEKSEKLKETLLEKAYDKENGCFYDSLAQDYTPTKHFSTHATAYALAYGVFQDQNMADDMCNFVYEKCKEEFKGSVYVTYFILKGLYVGNHGEMAEKLMTNPKVGTDVKTFASLLDNLNCTITPEAWGHKWKGNMTLSHPWGAAPGCSIVQGMFGILPTQAGFDEFTIKLQPGEIEAASVKAPSVKGAIEVSYQNGSQEQIARNEILATVTIPANTRAKVYLPVSGGEYQYLLIDGVETEGVNDGSFLMKELGSGTYQISISDKTVEYTPVLTINTKAGDVDLEEGESTSITTKVTNQFGTVLKDGLTLTYASTNEQVLTVDQDGNVAAIGEGTAAVEVTAEFKGVKKTESISFTIVKPPLRLNGLRLDISGENQELEEGKTAQASLYAVYNNGNEELIDPSKIAFTVTGDAASIDEKGVITGVTEGSAVIKAETTEKLTEIQERLDTKYLGLKSVWSFDGKTSPLNGVTVKDNALYAPVSQKVINTDEDKKGSVISGSFRIENVAANIAFNVKDDNNRYFWQFRADGYLKKHKGNADVFGDQVSIQLKDGDNDFLIATIENKIYTYLNKKLIDVCDVDPNMPVSGGFGVRNGMSESFYLSSLTLGSSLTLHTESTVVVSKAQAELPKAVSIRQIADIEVPYGTQREELNLPETLEVTFSDDTKRQIPVTWSGDYDGTQTGECVFTGELVPDESYENPNGIRAEVNVKIGEKPVGLPTVISIENPAEIQVPYETSREELNLPESVEVTFSDNTRRQIAVTWSGNYNEMVSGTYLLEGELLSDESFRNPDQRKAQIQVTVGEKPVAPPTVVSVESLTEIQADYGTSREQLELPRMVKITLSDGMERQTDVTWNGDYDGMTSGVYLLEGILASDGSFENPNEVMAGIKVIVREKPVERPAVVSVENPADIQAAYGTERNALNLPKTVTVVLSDGVQKSAWVNWTGYYDGRRSGSYQLEGTLAVDDSFTNSEQRKASIKVIVGAKPVVQLPSVISVDKSADRQVAYKTKWSALKLPSSVQIVLSGNVKKTVPVSWSGTYQETKAGTYLLKGTLGNDGSYQNPGNLSAAIRVTVNAKPIVKLNYTSLKIQKGRSTKALKASGLVSNDSIKKWTTSNKSVAIVDKKGVIHAKKAGTARITVTTKLGASRTCRLTVTKNPVRTTSIKVTNISNKKLTLKKGQVFRLKVMKKPVTATDKITYKSSDKTAVMVTAGGKVYAKKKGKTATVTIKTENGKKTSIKVTVK